MKLEDRIIPVMSPEGEAILTELRTSGDIVMLLGSAISSWNPGGLPTGRAVTSKLGEKLGSGTVAPERVVREMIENTAFEHVMECCPDEDHVRNIFAAAFHPVTPNEVHRAVVRLVEDRVVAHVVTTNYDTGLEAATSRPGVPLPVVRAEHAASVKSGTPLLYKIHGCATDPETMVFALRHEHLMDKEKRRLLRSLLGGRTLLVMGYSGLDFEICPELTLAGAARVIWVHLDWSRSPGDPDALDGMTANARRVLKETEGTVLWGDLLRVLESLGAGSVKATWSTVPAAFIDDLVDGLSPEDVEFWRMRLYNGIGCARDAWSTADRMAGTTRDSARWLDARIERARALFHLGKYRQAVAEYRAVVRDLEALGDRARLPAGLHGLAESSRVGGWYRQAHTAINKLDGLRQSAATPGEHAALEAEGAFLRILLLQNYHMLARRLGLATLEKRLRASALKLLRTAVPHAVETGDWLALQQGELWATRLGIRFDDLYDGPRLPLSAQEGYRQLGYHLAAMMALRGQLKRREIAPADVREPEKLIETAWEAGDYPEVWEFAAEYQKAGGTLSPELQALAVQARAQCEEGILRRIATRLGMG